MIKNYSNYLIRYRQLSEEKKDTIIFFCMIGIALIISVIIAVMLFIRRENEEMIELSHQAEIESIIPEEEVPDIMFIENEVNTKLPVYTENAKNRMNNIYVSNGVEKIAYLTFDDGPSSNVTPQILDILKEQDVKATFFVLGSRVELYPDLVKREYEEGHYIANHGYSHVYESVYASANAPYEEYERTENTIKTALGNTEYSSHLFRFPGGSEGGKYANLKNEAKSILAGHDVAYINWNALTNDAVGKPTYESLLADLASTSRRKR